MTRTLRLLGHDSASVVYSYGDFIIRAVHGDSATAVRRGSSEILVKAFQTPDMTIHQLAGTVAAHLDRMTD